MSSLANNPSRKRKTFSSSRSDAVNLKIDENVDDDDVFSLSTINASSNDPFSKYSLGKQRCRSYPDKLPDLLKNISTKIITPPGYKHDACSQTSVVFKDSDSVKQTYDRKDLGNGSQVFYRSKSVQFEPGEVSAKGEQKRQQYRKSSGYGTGDTDSSVQSQVSQTSDSSDSLVSNNAASSNIHSKEVIHLPKLSIFQLGDGDKSDLDSFHTVKNTDGPETSIYELHDNLELDLLPTIKNSSGNMNVPDLSIFKKNSGDSVCVVSGFTLDEFDSSVMASNFSVVENQENSPSPLLKLYEEKVLEEVMQAANCRPDKPAANAAKMLTNIALMQDVKQYELQMELFALILRECPDQDYLDLQSFVPDSLTHTPNSSSPHTLMQYLELSSTIQGQPVDSLGSEFKADSGLTKINFNFLKNLERSCRCDDLACGDKKCCRVKQMLKDFKETVQYCQPLKPVDFEVLCSLRAHSERCDALKCAVPWCSLLLSIDPWDEIEAINEIYIDYEQPTLRLCTNIDKDTIFFQIEDLGSGMFKKGEDWCVLSPLNESHNVVLATDFHSGNDATWVVKKAVLLDNKHQMHVYEKLCGLRWTNVVRHYWVMVKDSAFFICTEFHHGGTLSQMIEYQALQPCEVAFFMRQILEGVQVLHQKNIIYLNWTSCNMLLVDNRRVKISNLSMSVALDSDAEYNEIKNCLPPVILPPELLNKDPNLTLKSDSWGCACLVLELLSGKRVWHSLRHYSQEEIWEKLSKKATPPVPKDVGHLMKVFDACWKLDPACRKTVGEIEQMLR